MTDDAELRARLLELQERCVRLEDLVEQLREASRLRELDPPTDPALN